MKKYFKSFKGCVLTVLSLCLLASCESDTWKEHYSSKTDGTGEVKTLAAQLASIPQASKFVQVLKSTYIYDGDKQTILTYWKMLDDSHSQYLTVWVPSDDATDVDWDEFTKDLDDETKDHKRTGTEFILNHISPYRHAVNNSTSEKIYMLSEKSFRSYPTNIGGVAYKKDDLGNLITNIRCANGLIHVLADGEYMDYRSSIYEYLVNAPEYRDVLGEWFESYTVDELDPKKSVEGGINPITQEVEYIDSVMVKRSVLMKKYGLINEEDSTYALVLPSPTVWATMYDSVKQFFEYFETERGRDSLQKFYTQSAMLTDMFFNMNPKVQFGPNDSVVSTLFDKDKHKTNPLPYHVYYNPYSATGIFGGATDSIQLSNGIIYKWDTWPFEDSLTYRRTIKIEAEDAKLLTEQGFTLTRRYVSTINGKRLPKSIQVMEVTADQKEWDAIYPIEDNLKGWYEFKVVIAPNSNIELPNIFHPVVYYSDGSANNQTLIDDQTKVGILKKKKTYENDMTKLDTISIGKAFVPACNYKSSSSRLRFQISSAINGKLANDHTEKMWLDCLILEPIQAPTE